MLAHDADDGVQEVYIAIQSSLSRYRAEASLTTWGYRIAVRTLGRLVEARRRQRVREEPMADGADLVDPAEGGFDRSPLGQLDARERVARVRAAVDGLSEPYRAVIALRSGEGLSYAEIADALDVPLGTVKSRMATAMGLLAQRLQSMNREDAR